MKTVEVTTQSASEQAIRDGQREEVVVLDNGRPVALIVPFDEDDLEWYARERDPAFIESIARARAQITAGQTLSEADVRKQLGMEGHE